MMSKPMKSSDMVISRKIRAHKKSRRGCGNCKLRAVKCDEGKPACKKCTSYNVICNYSTQPADLQLSVDGAFKVDIFQAQKLPIGVGYASARSFAPSIRHSLSVALSNDTLVGPLELELLHKFYTRTIFTITVDQNRGMYQSSISSLCSQPHLLHALLTLTMMHDRYLSPTKSIQLVTKEAYHWHQATVLFNFALRNSVKPLERLALRCTSALLSIITFYHIEAKTGQKSWPLAAPSSFDLNWLDMSEGKKEVWKLQPPARESTNVQNSTMPENYTFPAVPVTPSHLETLPPEILAFFNISESSNINNNPYFRGLSTFAQTWKLNDDYTAIINFAYFLTAMEPEYKRLLKQKSPQALLLLGYWYQVVAKTRHWWIWKRALVECEAIYLYLERCCPREYVQGPLSFFRDELGHNTTGPVRELGK